MSDELLGKLHSPHGKIDIFDNVESLQEAAVNKMHELLQRAVDERGVATVALSGGSTPKRVYELLSRRDLPWSLIHWFWGDERNVPPDHAESNQRMVRESLLSHASIPEGNLHPVIADIDSPATAARAYERQLRAYFSGDDFPRWDLVLLGMGDDAHTASLFPETLAVNEQDRWFVENWVEKLSAFRYTLTAPAINSGREIWFLVSGAAKRQALHRVWQGTLEPDHYPSQLVQATRWLITSDADPNETT
jgi:6-phosphogluconolactonase